MTICSLPIYTGHCSSGGSSNPFLKGCPMQKLFFALLLLNCPAMAFAKTTLDVSVFLEQASEQQKHTTETRHKFDVTDIKNVSHTDGNMTCNWQIIHEGSKTVSILAKIVEIKDGVEKEVANPLLIAKWGEKATVKFGEKTPEGQTSLKVTAIITQD